MNITELEINTEEAMNKYRWNKIMKEDSKKGEKDSIFINKEKGEIDINNLRKTDLPFNYSVTMPNPIERSEEIKLHKFKNDVMKIGQEISEKCKKWSNVSKEEKEGIESLIERERKKELVCYKTDKSGRWSCETVENYKEGCLKLLADADKTPKITEEEHRKSEKEMNCQAMALTRMLGLKNNKAGDRIRWTLTAEGTRIAPLYGQRKDHKEIKEKDTSKGPEMRPICGAEDCATKRISYVLCMVLSQLIPGNETQCNSTEELIEVFKRVNVGDVKGDWILGSLDVKSLYPSLNIEKCAKVIRDRLNESKFQFIGQDWKEITLYLRYHMSEEELKEEGILHFCPKRKHNGKPPEFTSSGSDQRIIKRHGPWRFLTKAPDSKETKYMLCIAIERMIRRIMRSHDFEFAEEIYRQNVGGAIGLDLTGVLADIYMCQWDNVLLSKLQEEFMTVIIYKRYKDDINFIIDKTMVEGMENQTRAQIGENVVEKVKERADQIDSNIQVTTDISSRHTDGKLPLLDLKVWIGETKTGKTKILHEHYMKDVSSRLVIPKTSAHSERMKFNVMVNETKRIIRNCSEELEWNIVASHLSYFMRRLQFSGYDKKFRHQVIKRALNKYDKINDQIVAIGNRNNSKHKWYNKKGNKEFDSVMFVEATQDSVLKRKVQETAKKNNVKIKVIEKVGCTLKRLIQKSKPFARMKCGRDECIVCKIEGDIDCRIRGCVYKVRCKECTREYKGQTGRSIFERTKEHMEDWRKKMDRCPLWRHSIEYHGKKNFEFEIIIESECFGKPTKRMITEAVLIDNMPQDKTMNNKKEWSYVKLNRITIE